MAEMDEGLAERLETVRARQGLTLQDFWGRIVDKRGEEGYRWSKDEKGEEPRYSYRGVARYHRAERAPPVDYLRRVSKVFDVPIRWLVEGTGPDSKLHDYRWVAHPLERRLREESDWFGAQTMGVRWSFLDLVRMYEVPRIPGGPPEDPAPFDIEAEHAKQVEFILKLPLIAWGYDPIHLSDVPSSYWRGIIGALNDAVGMLAFGPRRDIDPAPRSEPFVAPFRQAYFGPNKED